MKMETVGTAATATPSEGCSGFWNTLNIWLKKPHVINRRLCGSRMVWQCTVSVRDSTEGWLTAIKRQREHGALFNEPASLGDGVTNAADSKAGKELVVYLRELLPRQVARFYILRELVVYDKGSSCATFLPICQMKHDGKPYRCTDTSAEDVSAGDIAYRLRFEPDPGRIIVQVSDKELIPNKHSLGCSVSWLTETLLPKLARWSGQEVLNTEVTSLRLVDVCRYNQLYQDLKAKYGPRLVQMWPEKTDPQKFVYEDIAIATYLVLIWEEDRVIKGLSQKQSFVDLGCGNGLLVYILASEGYPGLGLDVRKRNIWDMYGEDTQLKECSITPSDETLFPEYDWLIGNHSDELTPWIPMMAARSCYGCNYFVLPCCPWDFVGKFSGKVQGMSQYRSYLNYVQTVGKECGFHVEEDVLRIPSTKRVCFLGRSRTYPQDSEATADARRKEFLQSKCNGRTSHSQEDCSESGAQTEDKSATLASMTSSECTTVSPCTGCCHGNQASMSNPVAVGSAGAAPCLLWATAFQARSRVERVRNCVSVDRELQLRIVKAVFERLLLAEDSEVLTIQGGKQWNKGGSLALSEVVQLFDRSVLKQLKTECGGLQTLLRNAHHVFLVQGGRVEVRNWTSSDHASHQLVKKKRKGQHGKGIPLRKTKLCFFYENHPDGCPLTADDCRFAHGDAELKTVKSVSQNSTETLGSGKEEQKEEQRSCGQENDLKS